MLILLAALESRSLSCQCQDGRTHKSSHNLWLFISAASSFELSTKQRTFQLTMEFSFHPWYQFLFKSLSSQMRAPMDIPVNTPLHPQSNASSLKLSASILYNEAGDGCGPGSLSSASQFCLASVLILNSYPTNYWFSPPFLPSILPLPRNIPFSLSHPPRTTNVHYLDI